MNELKTQGNKAFQAKQYDAAIDLFSQAIKLDPTNHVLWSNRSAARAGKREWDGALADAEEVCGFPPRLTAAAHTICRQTIRVNPTWSKGFARKGAALHGASRWDEAIAAYEDGLKVEDSEALRKGLKEVKDAKGTVSMLSTRSVLGLTRSQSRIHLPARGWVWGTCLRTPHCLENWLQTRKQPRYLRTKRSCRRCAAHPPIYVHSFAVTHARFFFD